MTDTPGNAPIVRRPPPITRNIRAELARAGKTAREAQLAIGLPPSTWDDRMREPEYWRLGQLESLAKWLGVDVETLLQVGAR
jgi:hypothetical protein